MRECLHRSAGVCVLTLGLPLDMRADATTILAWTICLGCQGDGEYASLSDVPASQIAMLHEWFQNYKIPDGKPQNWFAFDGKPVGKERAIEAVVETHLSWAAWREGRRPCTFDYPLPHAGHQAGVNPCWKATLFGDQARS